ncbi:hypothetical protein ACWGBX_12050 [Streptomyces sp. NPDC055037]
MLEVSVVGSGMDNAAVMADARITTAVDAVGLAEETGEVAQQINRLEGMGVKRERHGEPDIDDLTKEVLDVVRCAVTIAMHYGCGDDLRALTSEKLASYRREGWVS